MTNSSLPPAARAVVRHKGYALLSAITLGIGIGASVAMFGLADALLMRPLLLPEVERVVMVGLSDGRFGRLDWLAPADYFDIQAQTTTLQHFSAYSETVLNIAGDGGEPEQIDAVHASAELFDAVGMKPILGRGFRAGEDQAGDDRVMVLSEGLWASRFGRDPSVLTKNIFANGKAYRIVGVMPADTRVPPQAQAWIPFRFEPKDRSDRDNFWIRSAVARLRPGVTLAAADAEMRALGGRIAQQYPKSHKRFTAVARPIVEEITGPETPAYARMMLWASLFLLLLACSNVANLHLARVSARAKEFALRTALGAGRGSLMASLAAEGLVLGALGAIAGLFLGAWGLELIKSAMPAEVERFLPGWKRISINPRVLAYAVAIAAGSGVIAALASAFSGYLTSPNDVLKESGRGTTAGRARHRMRTVLVAAQTMLAMMLLVGAGLTARGFSRIANPRIAGDPSRVLTMRSYLPVSSYPDMVRVRAFQEETLRRAQSLAGVESAALAFAVPYGDFGRTQSVSIEGQADPSDAFARRSRINMVSPEFFQAIGVTIHKGRAFTVQDGPETQPVAVVTQEFVRRYLASVDPIGRRVRPGLNPSNGEPWLTIVGIAADIRHNAGETEQPAELYRPIAQAPSRQLAVIVKSRGADPMALARPLRETIRSVDASQPVFDVKTLAKVISDDLTGYRFVSGLMGVFGALALVLAAVGVYSVISFLAAERTHEIGIRMAMGAQARDVVRQVMGMGVRLALAGLIPGLVAAVVLARMLGSLLFGVGSADAVSLVAVVAILLAASVLACVLPARRAASVDPLTALRHD